MLGLQFLSQLDRSIVKLVSDKLDLIGLSVCSIQIYDSSRATDKQ